MPTHTHKDHGQATIFSLVAAKPIMSDRPANSRKGAKTALAAGSFMINAMKRKPQSFHYTFKVSSFKTLMTWGRSFDMSTVIIKDNYRIQYNILKP